MIRLNVSALAIFFCFLCLNMAACKESAQKPANELIAGLNLKRGEVVSCGPADKEFGNTGFLTSCSDQTKKDFNLGIALLHSFEYDEAEKVFAAIIDKDPECAMAYWGVAMSNYHPLWAPPTPTELEKGAKAISIAQSLGKKNKKEKEYIDGLSSFYENWSSTAHPVRIARFETAMQNLHKNYPDDKEATIFYALALTGAADPTDKSFSKQKRAGELLNGLYPGQPDHPGIIHYIIHSYDYPELAEAGLEAARKYASIAPSSAHAQHMPSHIFIRLGLWTESIQSNNNAAASAKCYAESTGIKGHWDEELHAIDYLVYAHLQRGDNESAKKTLAYLRSVDHVEPMNFKVAYCFAASPARYVLENKLWKEASALSLYGANTPWQKFPWQEAIHQFARLMGFIHTAQLDSSKQRLSRLQLLKDSLTAQKDAYKANQVAIQIKTGLAWIQLKEGNTEEAIATMKLAARMEDSTQKHPVTPGEVLPARELLADMLLAANKPEEALAAYEESLRAHTNRFNGVYGAALAAEKINDTQKAVQYYELLLQIADPASPRPELAKAKLYLKTRKI